jgi:hypothetical protein
MLVQEAEEVLYLLSDVKGFPEGPPEIGFDAGASVQGELVGQAPSEEGGAPAELEIIKVRGGIFYEIFGGSAAQAFVHDHGNPYLAGRHCSLREPSQGKVELVHPGKVTTISGKSRSLLIPSQKVPKRKRYLAVRQGLLEIGELRDLP